MSLFVATLNNRNDNNAITLIINICKHVWSARYLVRQFICLIPMNHHRNIRIVPILPVRKMRLRISENKLLKNRQECRLGFESWKAWAFEIAPQLLFLGHIFCRHFWCKFSTMPPDLIFLICISHHINFLLKDCSYWRKQHSDLNCRLSGFEILFKYIKSSNILLVGLEAFKD